MFCQLKQSPLLTFVAEDHYSAAGNLNIGRNNFVNLIQIPGIVCILLHSSRSFPPLPETDDSGETIRHPEKCDLPGGGT